MEEKSYEENIICFVLLLFAEIATLIVVGKAIGVFNTLALIVITSISGVYDCEKEWIEIVQEIQKSIAQGQPPGVPMIETFMIFVRWCLISSARIY